MQPNVLSDSKNRPPLIDPQVPEKRDREQLTTNFPKS
jgi:hypothetical protein